MDYYLLSDQDLDEIVWGIENLLWEIEKKFKEKLIYDNELDDKDEGD